MFSCLQKKPPSQLTTHPCISNDSPPLEIIISVPASVDTVVKQLTITANNSVFMVWLFFNFKIHAAERKGKRHKRQLAHRRWSDLDNAVTAVTLPDTGSTFGLLFLAVTGLLGATR